MNLLQFLLSSVSKLPVLPWTHMAGISPSELPSSTQGKDMWLLNTASCVGRVKSSHLMTHLAPLGKVRLFCHQGWLWQIWFTHQLPHTRAMPNLCSTHILIHQYTMVQLIGELGLFKSWTLLSHFWKSLPWRLQVSGEKRNKSVWAHAKGEQRWWSS